MLECVIVNERLQYCKVYYKSGIIRRYKAIPARVMDFMKNCMYIKHTETKTYYYNKE